MHSLLFGFVMGVEGRLMGKEGRLLLAEVEREVGLVSVGH